MANPDPNKLTGGDLRVSDHDRTRVTDELRIHCVDGRISVEELETRVQAAMSAQTVHDLALIVVDLPTISAAAPPLAHRGRTPIGPPGVRPFTQRLVVPARLKRTRAIALETIAPSLNGHGYELRRESETALEFERTGRPGVTVLAAIVLFPLGLLALLARSKEWVVISLESHDSEQTTMIIRGRASRKVRRVFAELTFI